jgi:DNA-binding transcriptional MerR regulator
VATPSIPSTLASDVPDGAWLTVDELAAAAGVPVRTIRFYAGKKLLPPPRLEGRTGLYGPAHLARLTLVRDLQHAGYTLAAIEQFLATLPEDADADAIRLYGTLLTPWLPEEATVLTRQELADRLDRDVDDELLRLLEAANVLEVTADDRVALTGAQLEFGLRLLDLDAPLDALVEAGQVIRRNAAGMAEELQQVFRDRILAEFDDASPEDRVRLRALAAGLRPLTIQAIVTAFQEALDREVRSQTVR